MAKENTEEIKEYSNFIHDFIDKDLEDGDIIVMCSDRNTRV